MRVLGAIAKFLSNLHPLFAKPYTRSNVSIPKIKLSYTSLILLSVGSEVKEVISEGAYSKCEEGGKMEQF